MPDNPLSPDVIEPPKTQRRPLRQVLPKLLLTTAYFWVPALIFLKLADEVLDKHPLFGDESLLRWLHHFANPDLNGFAVFVTTLGSAPVVVLGVLLASGILVYSGHRRPAVFLAFSAAGTAIINVLFKLLFHRHRPTLWHQIVTENGYSFPSGHAMISSALAFSIIILCWKTRYRWPIAMLSTIYFLAVGISRLYLGVHYPSDVIGGWCVSLLWVLTVHKVFDTYGRHRTPVAISPTSK